MLGSFHIFLTTIPIFGNNKILIFSMFLGLTKKNGPPIVATPLWASGRMKLTLLKLGTWSPSGLPNV